VNVTKPRPTLSDRSDALSYIADRPPIYGVSTVPCAAYSGGHPQWRTMVADRNARRLDGLLTGVQIAARSRSGVRWRTVADSL